MQKRINMIEKQAKLVLEDGTVYDGVSFGAHSAVAGEVVFNTGMVGYPETLTDPSYCGQILVLTYPLIGNYGVPAVSVDEHGLPLGFESHKIQIAGLVVSEYSPTHSHFDAAQSLGNWMKRAAVPGISGVDTRALTRRLREKGSMLGKIAFTDEEMQFYDPMACDLVSKVSLKETAVLNDVKSSGRTIVLLDCGCKASIVRSLITRGLRVVQVPYDHYFLDLDYDGLLISNGPGDPGIYTATIRHVEHALAVGKPILGICLGNQILALAAGAETYKLKFGHRGQNQPCIEFADDIDQTDSTSKRCVITSQNHGYAVRPDRLSDSWQIWFKNANDNTVEGIRHRTKPFMGVQFHPEATPGPTDTAWIFDAFADAVKGRG
ncbi:MAG: glutamine-hydrolyzing carbamoyl-phosphate synthase small subunit [Myxococcota bacterium]|nr:glutamine-hydrolyzing carbamoyl-phosphate synthase small subunit [Myxococcota bacterium]